MLRRRPTAFLRALSPAALGMACGLALLPSAQAGIFDDDEARRQIAELTQTTNERLDTAGKAQFELANQIQALREENARLRGQIETLAYELESASKRQQDFYIDLDSRLRKIEPAPVADEAAAAPAAPAADPAAESRAYEEALNLFKAKKLKEAAAAFSAFVKAHPDSTLAPNAQYWFGNAQYALGDCKQSIEAHNKLLARWPKHAKAADAMLNIASCQKELGDAKAARKTLQTLKDSYPGTPAAESATQRLKQN
ncbi:tol-pal system protein YbgF [Rhodocyclus purpureus]|uniref:tol-pal system protein YbgF n=1 Tax=Rhodocyclus purpureus TaxID=1067 RepID=UPI00191432E0|nr:tol-pal system protein YbgF [Rhodocyclus purpureus]MBK5913125.1 tol-pal system protein YbgF [Rhodocyclus purpureus]